MVILVAVGALVSCGGTTGGVDLTGITWTLTEMEGQPPLPDVTVDLILSEDGSVSGSSGCNRYTGEATFADGEMTLGPNLASTRMACEEAIMSQEDAYLRLLQQVAGYEVVDGQLHLTDADGNLLARFE